jgi:hypothetical protein
MAERWEYRLVAAPQGRHGPTEIETILNRYGAEGWELVCLGSENNIFKRKIVDTAIFAAPTRKVETDG